MVQYLLSYSLECVKDSDFNWRVISIICVYNYHIVMCIEILSCSKIQTTDFVCIDVHVDRYLLLAFDLW